MSFQESQEFFLRERQASIGEGDRLMFQNDTMEDIQELEFNGDEFEDKEHKKNNDEINNISIDKKDDSIKDDNNLPSPLSPLMMGQIPSSLPKPFSQSNPRPSPTKKSPVFKDIPQFNSSQTTIRSIQPPNSKDLFKKPSPRKITPLGIGGKRFDFSFQRKGNVLASLQGKAIHTSPQPPKNTNTHIDKENIPPSNESLINLQVEPNAAKNSPVNNSSKVEEELDYTKGRKALDRIAVKENEANEMLQQIVKEMDASIISHKKLNSELVDLKHKLAINLDPTLESLVQIQVGNILLQDQIQSLMLLNEDLDFLLNEVDSVSRDLGMDNVLQQCTEILENDIIH